MDVTGPCPTYAHIYTAVFNWFTRQLMKIYTTYRKSKHRLSTCFCLLFFCSCVLAVSPMMDVRDSWTDIFGLKLILDSAETTTIFGRPSQSILSVSCVVSEATPSSKSIGGEIEFRSSSQSCVGRNAKSVVEGDFQRWIFVESLRRGRRRRRAVQTSLALLPVL